MNPFRSTRSQDNSHQKTQTVAVCGLFIALSMLFSYIESLIPFNFGVPGIKLGLANIVSLVSLFLVSPFATFCILAGRIVLSSLLFGNLAAMLYSLAGGLLSFLVMFLLKKTGRFSIMGISAAGGVAHNIGQLLVASLVVSSLNIFFLLPALLVSGILTGVLIGYTSNLIIKKQLQ